MDDDSVIRVTATDLDRLEMRAVQSGQHADAAQELLCLADRVDSRSEIPRAELLVRAGEQWEHAEEYEHALAAYQLAVEDGGTAVVDARALQVGPLLELGRAAAARQLLDILRAEGPRNLPTYITIVETLYAHSDLKAAHEWATLGVHRFRAQDVSDYVHNLLVNLLRARFRIGVDLGLADDELDRMLDEE